MAKMAVSFKTPTWEELQEQKDAGLLTPTPTWEDLQSQKDQGLLAPKFTLPSREQAYEELGLTPKDPTWGDVIKHSLTAGLYQTSANVNNLLRLIQTGAVKLTDAVTNIFDEDFYDPNKDAILNALNGLQNDIEQTVVYNQEQAKSKDWLKNFIGSGLQAVPQIATSAFLGTGMPGAPGTLAKMIPFGTLAGSGHARQTELEGGEYWQQVLSGVMGGMGEMATEMPVYAGITKLLQSTGAMKAVNQGAKNLIQTHGQKGIEFLKDLALQSWQEAEMVPLEKAIKQVLGFPQDWSIKPLIKEMGEQAKGGLAMALIMGGLGGGYVGVNQVMNESIQRQEPPEITVQRIIAQVEEEAGAQETAVEEAPVETIGQPTIETQPTVQEAPQVMTYEEYATSKGYGEFAYSEPALHKQPGATQKEIKNRANQAWGKGKEWQEQRDALRKEYNQKIASGEIRLPTRIEQLIKTARGHEDNEATQAARRLLKKQGIDWEFVSKEEIQQPKQEIQIEPWQQSLKQYAPETPPEGVSAEDYNYVRQSLIEEWQDSVREAHESGKPVPQEILNEYPEFVEEIQLKEATKKQEAEIQKELDEYKKDIHKAIRRLGGINDKDYEDIPLYLKRKTGRGLDELVLEMQGEGFQVQSADDLYSLIQESKGIKKPVRMSSKEKEIRQKYFQIPAVQGTGELKERGLSVHAKNRILQQQTGIDFEDQTLYQQADFKAMAQKVDQVFTTNPEQALRIAMGEENPPEGTLAGMYWTAAENQAILNKDTKTLNKLMNSKINEVATALGQNIAAFRERNPFSPIRIVKEINKALETQFTKQKPTIKIQLCRRRRMKKSAPNLDAVTKPSINTWEKFINSITC